MLISRFINCSSDLSIASSSCWLEIGALSRSSRFVELGLLLGLLWFFSARFSGLLSSKDCDLYDNGCLWESSTSSWDVLLLLPSGWPPSSNFERGPIPSMVSSTGLLTKLSGCPRFNSSSIGSADSLRCPSTFLESSPCLFSSSQAPLGSRGESLAWSFPHRGFALASGFKMLSRRLSFSSILCVESRSCYHVVCFQTVSMPCPNFECLNFIPYLCLSYSIHSSLWRLSDSVYHIRRHFQRSWIKYTLVISPLVQIRITKCFSSAILSVFDVEEGARLQSPYWRFQSISLSLSIYIYVNWSQALKHDSIIATFHFHL